jgi:hypothetical protein
MGAATIARRRRAGRDAKFAKKRLKKAAVDSLLTEVRP